MKNVIAPPALGRPLDPNAIERVPADIRAINGMHFADGALYANVNDYERKFTRGFYRIKDSDGDDRLEKVELLRTLNPGGDHGLHGVVPVPGSDDIYLVLGNRTVTTKAEATSPMPMIWGGGGGSV